MQTLTSSLIRISLRKIAAVGIAVLMLTTSFPRTTYAQDNGDASFVKQIIPLLLGRKPSGHDEVKLWTDLVPIYGRETVMRAMMDQPEFVDNWAEFFVDQLRVHRETSKAQTSCFGPGHRPTSDGGALALWVRDHDPNAGAAPGGAFNMTDLVRSSLELDDLSPVYRAYLFAMVSKPATGNEITELNKRDDFGVTFSNVYLHRQMLCLSCHNSEFSVSGSFTHWNRTHPMWGSFERSLYSSPSGIDVTRAHAVFRTAVNEFSDTDPADSGAALRKPWGIEDCGSFRATVPTDPEGIDAFFTRSFGRTGSVWNVEASLHNGYVTLARDGLIRSNPDNDGDGVRDTLDNDAAFAFMVAANIVNQTFSEVMGYPLTIPNYFPRNARQLGILWILTEFNFIPRGWSLKELLVKILTSEFFNRKSPMTATGTTAYDLPMLFDPWVENDPRFPPESLSGWTPTGPPPTRDPAHSPTMDPDRHKNAMGEIIHRYTPRSLLYSVSRALDWPEPERFPGSSYPSADLMKAIGQFSRDAEPGFRSVDFQGLLQWESIHGACAKPNASDDWINRLVAAIPAFDAAHPGSPATVQDLVITTKDWLINEGQISSTTPVGETISETSALETHFGVPLTQRASTVSQLETKMRGLCGVLIQTPQFMLAGIQRTGLGSAPRMRVCNGTPCTYQEICNAIKPAVDRVSGRTLMCSAGSVTASLAPLMPAGLSLLCPQGLCNFVRWRGDPECLADPLRCRRTIPVCDPRCTRIDCCGGPLPPIDQPGVMLGWAEGGRVIDVSGVEILPYNGKRFISLTRNRVLRAGDILRIKPGAQLNLKTQAATFKTTALGMPKRMVQTAIANGSLAKEADSPWLFLVTGPSALKMASLVSKPTREVSGTQLRRILSQDWLRYGEAGQPLKRPPKRSIDSDRMSGRRKNPEQKQR